MKGIHIISLILPCLLAFVSADIYDEFLDAEPIFPTIRVSEEPFKDDDSKIELATNFTTEFVPADSCSVNKTGLKVGEAGVITTPYYPRNYPGRSSCEWNLEGVEGTQIEATVFDLFVQPWFFTYFDYVLISKNGDYKKVDKMSGDMNGKTPFTITSEANKFGIRFVSSSLFNFRGMKVQYVVKSASKESSIIQKENSPFNGNCGLSNLINSRGLDDLIIGPGKAVKGSFPWMAALLIDGRSFCGGSIISKRHILTAAHCTDGARRITVLLGAENIKNKQNPDRQLFNVTNHDIYQHQSYNPITISHDISILHLSEDIEFNENVRPICLPNRFFLSESFEGDEVRVSGWGKPRDRAPAISPDLKNTTLSIMTNSKCRRQFRSLVTGNLICTATKWNASPCRGDSGGPLIVKKTLPSGKEFFMQVGIVSFGGGSCERGIPVGFTRVTAFLDYISEITGQAFF